MSNIKGALVAELGRDATSRTSIYQEDKPHQANKLALLGAHALARV
ncbi:hypothetical protein [Hahella sp. HN01]|nr:hypothetical protein [Hahella sp. HN01]MBU6951018.1 hypothetical protein [Hahella sp. HN01]